MLSVCGALLAGCGSRRPEPQASILFTRVPKASEGGEGEHDFIGGTVTGSRPNQQVVLYARNGRWWLQPLVDKPFTRIQQGHKWVNSTHLGMEYAALLVNPGYAPQATIDDLPALGGAVAAVAIVKGQKTSPSPVLSFSGYDWIVRDAPSDRGGTMHNYRPANVWIDRQGALHLRITKADGQWTCAEMSLTRSLGFGTYAFTVRDVSPLEPATVFGMFTWDWAAPEQNFSEMDMEISRWGDPASKNAQYVIQPFYIPANVFRFSIPPGRVTHSLKWAPGRVSLKTVAASGRTVAHYDFTSGVPSPGLESVRVNLYPYHFGKVALEKGAEVVVEKFEYLP